MNLNRKKLSIAVMHAVNAGLVFGLAAPLAYAQQATTPPVQTLDRVEVTGSRISSETFESASPINVITQQDIQFTGLQSSANIINQLPQAFADQGGSSSNGATGTSTANLRGLGPNRTLVLVDGKRLPAGSPSYYATNLNQIPAPLIKRVEVLTGGASSVYGSDAIAGVINFIMNDNFEGVQAQWSPSFYQHNQHNAVGSVVAAREATNPAQFQVPGDFSGEGTVQDFNLTVGSNFANNKGNATLFFQYQKTDAILQSQYDYSACSLGANAAGFNCGGSGTASGGRFDNLTTGRSYTLTPNGGVRPFVNALDQYNFGPTNYYQRPETRYQFNAFAHYDVFPQLRLYTEFDYSNTTSTSQVAPGGIFLSVNSVNNENPYLSQAFKDALGIPNTPGHTDILLGKRNVEGGGRIQDFSFNDYRFVIGAKGDFANHTWDYDFWWQSGRNNVSSVQANYFSSAKIPLALDAVRDPQTGAAVCVSGPPCVPYDVFNQNGITQAQLDYLSIQGLQSGYTSQSVVGLHVTSDLGTAYGWKTPWAKNGVGVAFGVERRVEKLANVPDAALQAGDLNGTGGATLPISGQYTVTEAFAEFKVPIIERQNWAYNLNFDGSYRYSNYDTGQNTNSYGLGVEWAPIKGYTLRGSYQQAVRAANIIELFQGQGTNLFDGIDPCAGPNPSASLAGCLRTGLAANLYGSNFLESPAGQYNYLQGGNPNLEPEKSDSYTVGLVFDQPFKGFSATIDYWNIKVKNLVGIVSAQEQLNECVTSGLFCNNIHRDSLGTLWLDGGGLVTATNQNLGSYHTSGIDLTANYNWPIDRYGSVLFSFIGTYIDQFIIQSRPGGSSFDCVGLYGASCQGVYPRWRNSLRTTWFSPYNVDVSLNWRYIDSVSTETTSSNPGLAGTTIPVLNHLPSRSYIDLVGAWRIDKNWSMRAGVNNILDKDPPLTTLAGPSINGNGNTFPNVYDSLGRLFFFNITAKF